MTSKLVRLQHRLELEIIDIDHDLELLSSVSPQSRPVVNRIRDALGRCVHLVNGCDTREFCSSGFEDDGGLQ